MHFTFLEELKILSGYADIRSVRRWLAGMNLRLVRLGKRYAVDQEAFEKALIEKFGPKKQLAAYRPTTQWKKNFQQICNPICPKNEMANETKGYYSN